MTTQAATCTSCGAVAPPGARFCPSCAAPLGSGAAAAVPDEETALAPEGGLVPPPRSPTPGSASSVGSSADEGRFLPGQVIAERYRIVGLLGRGGMGEVYRADDLKLGQPVALKFLPEAVAHDRDWLERFLNEVKVARQISHPHVCRVHDVGEVDGHHYLSMEYIDGEDLASLLRRIGRLPEDKAVQIARQVCAGLAAAHDRGVLHRDLKPANVMVDGQGNARITDFGLAGLAESISADDVISGTPAYMAPEQLAGREVTERSDLYALGLVLYQLFTGKPAFKADTLAEISRMHREEAPTSPSSLVAGLDPAVERIVLRCLEKDPGERPASALAVAAALPGGDPLAAALAAGETPSPEMVAAAGEEGSLAPKVALSLLVGLVVATAAYVGLSGRYQVTSVIPMDKSVDVLEDRAQELVSGLGVEDESRVDTAHGFDWDWDYRRYLESDEFSDDAWKTLAAGRPAYLRFWYRQSPRTMVPLVFVTRVDWSDPAQEISDSVALRLDMRGNLVEYVRVPRQTEDRAEADAGPPAPDWAGLFAAADLEMEGFSSVAPVWVPPVFADERAAWTGELPGLSGTPVRVEAAAYRGEPVYFRLIGPWSRAERETQEERSAGIRARQVINLVVILIALGVGTWMARRNLRGGRGDYRGATRLALFMFAIQLLSWVVFSHHTGRLNEEFRMFILTASVALFNSAAAWMLYLALEPSVRRHSPQRIVAWSRLLAGRFKDPLVGRDVLVGLLTGAVVGLAVGVTRPLQLWIGTGTILPLGAWTQPLLGTRATVAAMLDTIPNATFGAMLFVFLWFLLSRFLRWRWLAGVVYLAILVLSFSGGTSFSWVSMITALVLGGLFLLILTRFGLLAIISTLVSATLITNPALSWDLSAWWTRGSWLMLLALALLAVYAFRVAVGGRQVLEGPLLDD